MNDNLPAANRADRHVKHLAGRHTKPPLLPRREFGLAALIVSVIVIRRS